jgi:nitrite reductase/ring-hydroxylating ferredoxin subunit
MAKIFLGKIEEVQDGRSRTFVKNGKKILVTNIGGNITAYENFCPHMGGALRYDGKKIVCSWHGACFNAATGIATANIDEGAKLTPLTVVVEAGALYFDDSSVQKSPWADDF